MSHQNIKYPWAGFLRFTFPLLCALVFFSTITFGLAVAYVEQLYSAPFGRYAFYGSSPHRWSTG